MSQVVGLPNSSYKSITNTAWVRARLCKLQKGCTRLAAACDQVDQLIAHGRWFSPGTPASSTTKTCRHDIAEILLKVALSTKNQSIIDYFYNISIYTIPEQALPQYQIVIVWQLDLRLPMQPVPITINVVSSNTAHGEVSPIQNYVIKFANGLRQIGGILLILHQ